MHRPQKAEGTKRKIRHMSSLLLWTSLTRGESGLFAFNWFWKISIAYKTNFALFVKSRGFWRKRSGRVKTIGFRLWWKAEDITRAGTNIFGFGLSILKHFFLSHYMDCKKMHRPQKAEGTRRKIRHMSSLLLWTSRTRRIGSVCVQLILKKVKRVFRFNKWWKAGRYNGKHR